MNRELIPGSGQPGPGIQAPEQGLGPTVGRARACGCPGRASTLPILGIHAARQPPPPSLPPGTAPA